MMNHLKYAMIPVICSGKAILNENKIFKDENKEDKDNGWLSPSSYFYLHKNPPSFSENWDMVPPQGSIDGKKSPPQHTIILVRHGQYYEASSEDKNKKLTNLGCQQASSAGKRIRALEKEGKIPPIKYVYYSTMMRATETSNLLVKELNNNRLEKENKINVEACSMIREGAVHRTDPSSTKYNPGAARYSKEGIRAEAGFMNHMHRSKEPESYTTVLVCHGNVIRYFALRALQLLPERWLSTAVYNGSITILNVYDNGRVSLTNLGDVGHLPPKMITYRESDGDGGFPATEKIDG